MFATITVLVAILFGIARLLTPYVSDYKTDISEVVSEYIGQAVKVHGLKAEWHGLGPALVLEEVALLDKKGEKPVLEFSEARLEFNVITSLIFFRPDLSNITLVGANLVLVRDKDRHISIAGFEGKKGDTGDLDAVTEWISSQGEIRLEKSNVRWRDEINKGREMNFTSINVRLINTLNRHSLYASVDLPQSLGRSLTFYVVLKGDLLDATDRNVKVYFQGEKLKFTEFLQTQSIAGKSANVGETDFQLWAQWENGVLQEVEGEVDVDKVSLFSVKDSQDGALKKTPGSMSINLERLAGEFKWQSTKNGWNFDANDLVLIREKSNWLPSRVSIKVENGRDTLQSIDAYASHLQLEDATQILKLFSVGGEEFETSLDALKPRGLVHNARIIWHGGNDFAYKAYAKLDRASTNAWKFIPATNHIYGQLWLEENKGQVVLEKADMTLNFPGLFRWPIDVDEVSGQVDWTVNKDSWALMGNGLTAKNKDISSSASFGFVKDNIHKSPFMSLVAHFKDGDGSQVAHYLPTGIMPNTAVKWLDTAIVGGHVISGGTIMHGRLSDFPFDNGNGKFEVRFAVEDGRLEYAKGWPAISDIDANVQFIGRSMSINAKHGKIYSNEIQWAKVVLPNMTLLPMPLLVDGDVAGSTQDKLKYLVVSPQLRESFGKHLEGLAAGGESLLHLDLVLPIGNYKNTAVKGWVDLKNDTLAMPALGNVLSDVTGRLHYSQDGLSMETVNAELFGQPTNLKVSTENIEENNWIRIDAKGLFDAKKMAKSYLPPITKFIDGKGGLDVLFDIPLGEHRNVNHIATLNVKADFEGVESRLPAPFTKKAGESTLFDMNIDFSPDADPVLHATYGQLIDGILVLNNEAVSGIKSGDLRINSGAAVLPTNTGVRVNGRFDTVKVSDWLSIWAGNISESLTQEANLPRFHDLDMSINNLEAYGQKLHNVRLIAKPVEKGWDLDINSKEAVGQVKIPTSLSLNPVKAKFDHIYLSEPQLGVGDSDPRDIPSLDFDIKTLRYESRKFGSLRLETTSVANGVRIEQIVLKPKKTKIIASGGWYINGEEHESSIQANVQSTDVGKTLKELGYVGAIDGGEGEVNLQLQWPGSFYDVDVNKVRGNLQMDLKNGQLLEIDPGAGRLFGMLSLQTLPRRLFLDFSDVFAKGFGFDQIKGKFNIEHGNAYTEKLKLDGPAAKVEVKGRVGLAQQDYDQLVTVTPKVTESLPVLGALTSTPQVGAVILFFQKIFQPGIEEATKNQYTITGHWDDPVIKRVKSSKPKQK